MERKREEKWNGNEIDEWNRGMLVELMETLKKSDKLMIKKKEDLDYLNSFSKYRRKSKEVLSKSLHIARSLVSYSAGIDGLSHIESDPAIEDILIEFEDAVSIIDSLLDEVDSLLDWKDSVSSPSPSSLPSDSVVASDKNIVKPQLFFREKIDNSNTPFKPKLTEKHNALVPLEDVFSSHEEIHKHAKEMGVSELSDFESGYPHPYAPELLHLEWSPLQSEELPVEIYLPLGKTPLIWVDSLEALKDLSRILKKEKAFAIDLEHHHQRSFQGLVCLMQISTYTTDYIVDPLCIWEHVHILNDPFTDSSIVKILHGCDLDVLWLQRDFGIYLVNVFDTGVATHALEFPRHGLAYLLDKYCSITADKQYQLADWRIRPLPDVMVKYAREDTHYLLYIHDRLKNELITGGRDRNSNLLLAVLDRSRELCMKRYEKPLVHPNSYLNLKIGSISVRSLKLTVQQMEALRRLFFWRDTMAREEDENPFYVLPHYLLLRFAKELPVTRDTLYATCGPNAPPLVRTHVDTVLDIMRSASAVSLSKASFTKKSNQASRAPIHSITPISDDLSNDSLDLLRQSTPSPVPRTFLSGNWCRSARAAPENMSSPSFLPSIDFSAYSIPPINYRTGEASDGDQDKLAQVKAFFPQIGGVHPDDSSNDDDEVLQKGDDEGSVRTDVPVSHGPSIDLTQEDPEEGEIVEDMKSLPLLPLSLADRFRVSSGKYKKRPANPSYQKQKKKRRKTATRQQTFFR